VLNEPACWNNSSLSESGNPARPKSAPLTASSGVTRTCERITAAVLSMTVRSIVRRAPSRSADSSVAEPRHAAHELVDRGESRRAVGQRFGDVLGVHGQDAQRTVALPDDAGVHEAPGAGAGLVRHLGAEGKL